MLRTFPRELALRRQFFLKTHKASITIIIIAITARPSRDWTRVREPRVGEPSGASEFLYPVEKRGYRTADSDQRGHQRAAFVLRISRRGLHSSRRQRSSHRAPRKVGLTRRRLAVHSFIKSFQVGGADDVYRRYLRKDGERGVGVRGRGRGAGRWRKKKRGGRVEGESKKVR